MNRKLLILLMTLAITALVACNSNNKVDNNENADEEELVMIEVEFEVPETADVGETITLKATVTYGDELVSDVDELDFEYWEEGHKDDSVTIQATNNGDGIYTAEVAFDHDGVYSIYAHTTAKGMHSMPLRSITIGEGAAEGNNHDHAGGHEHVEGFGMHFMNPENAFVNQETKLVVHVQMDDHPLEKADVRYEIWNDDVSKEHSWVEAEESVPGEYIATHTFKDAGTYTVQIHVENDEGLHEHEEYEIEVK